MISLITVAFIAAGIPTAVTGFCFWLLERRITIRDAEEAMKSKKRQEYIDQKEANRDELQYKLIESVNASIALSEATARALQRLPNSGCNGDMEKALAFADATKRNQRDFLTRMGIKQVNTID